MGVGVGVGASILILAGVFFFLRKKRDNAAKDSQNPYHAEAAPDYDGKPHYLVEMDNSEAAQQYYSPSSHVQKYAYYASENPSTQLQRYLVFFLFHVQFCELTCPC